MDDCLSSVAEDSIFTETVRANDAAICRTRSLCFSVPAVRQRVAFHFALKKTRMPGDFNVWSILNE